jgi:hypothetical protein
VKSARSTTLSKRILIKKVCLDHAGAGRYETCLRMVRRGVAKSAVRLLTPDTLILCACNVSNDINTHHLHNLITRCMTVLRVNICPNFVVMRRNVL